jgi:hypothetical protein
MHLASYSCIIRWIKLTSVGEVIFTCKNVSDVGTPFLMRIWHLIGVKYANMPSI